MSENLDLVRSIYADWERGDFASAEWAHPEIEYAIPDGIAASSTTGIAGMAMAFGAFASAWHDYRVELGECREIDPERVLATIRLIGRGKTSGVELAEMHAEAAHVFTIRDGRVTRLVNYADRERALADLGLEE
jgi:ketosteroid isomerase-like protein